MDEINETTQADNYSTTGLSRISVNTQVKKQTLVDITNKINTLDYYKRFELITNYIAKTSKIVEPTFEQFEDLSTKVLTFKSNLIHLQTTSKILDPVIYKHLAFTLFAPAGKAIRAKKAVDDMSKAGIFEDIHQNKHIDNVKIAELIKPNVRFHTQKAIRFCSAANKISTLPIVGSSLDTNLEKHKAIETSHNWLLNNIKGLGKKATAHFMRNIGLWDDYKAYPIIDIHIKKLLDSCNLKMGTYEIEEQSFQKISELFGIPVLLLDAYVWCMYSGNWNTKNADFDNFKD